MTAEQTAQAAFEYASEAVRNEADPRARKAGLHLADYYPEVLVDPAPSPDYFWALVRAVEAQRPGMDLWNLNDPEVRWGHHVRIGEPLWRACVAVNPSFDLAEFKSWEKIDSAKVIYNLAGRVIPAPFDAPKGYREATPDEVREAVVSALALAGQDFSASTSSKWRLRDTARVHAFLKEGDAAGRGVLAVPLNRTPSSWDSTLHDHMAFGQKNARTAAKHVEPWLNQFDTLGQLL